LTIELLGTLDNEDNRGIPEWRLILQELDRTGQSNPRPIQRQDFANSHATTIRRIGGADYHYHILNQIYVPNVTPMRQFTTIWTEIETESVTFMLYSSLDSLMQEINLTYKFGIPEFKIDVNHDPASCTRQARACVRCALDGVNDSLTTYLNSELSSTWFDALRKLRNRISHKQLLATNTNLAPTAYIEMPTDPEAIPYTEVPRAGVELNGYCVTTRSNVARVISQTYQIIMPKIRDI